MNWKTCKIGEVVDLEQGLCINAKSRHLLVDNGIPLLRITDMINNTSCQYIDEKKVPRKYVAKPNEIIFTRTGQVGLVFRGKLGIVHNNCFKVIPNEQIHYGYLYWYLKQNPVYEYVNGIASGAAQPDLGHNAFKSIIFYYPSLQVQMEIDNILSAYDNLIENNNRRIELLEKEAQDLYKEWFVRFRFPNYKHTKSKNGLPVDWKFARISELVNTQYGYTASAELDEVGPKFIRITDIAQKKLMWDAVPYCKIESKDALKYRIEAGDILVARTGATVGYAKWINKKSPEAVFASFLVRLKPKDKKLSLMIGMVVESEQYKSFIQAIATGAAQPQANAQLLTLFSMVIPDKNTIDMFNSIVEPMKDEIENLQTQNQNLIKQRDLLLPRLMSGKLEV